VFIRVNSWLCFLIHEIRTKADETSGPLQPISEREHPRMTRQRSPKARFSKPRKFAFICCCFLFLLCPAAPAFAQHGGKAEPLRIEFKRGTNSTTVSGSVQNSEEYEYVLAAKKGQRLTIKITSTPVKSSVFEIVGENHDTLGLEYDANFDYSGVLPKDGDYFITVSRPTTLKGTSTFKLTITIK
jgi:hypothetical protein